MATGPRSLIHIRVDDPPGSLPASGSLPHIPGHLIHGPGAAAPRGSTRDRCVVTKPVRYPTGRVSSSRTSHRDADMATLHPATPPSGHRPAARKAAPRDGAGRRTAAHPPPRMSPADGAASPHHPTLRYEAFRRVCRRGYRDALTPARHRQDHRLRGRTRMVGGGRRARERPARGVQRGAGGGKRRAGPGVSGGGPRRDPRA
jgi:hypothetical protein